MQSISSFDFWSLRLVFTVIFLFSSLGWVPSITPDILKASISIPEKVELSKMYIFLFNNVLYFSSIDCRLFIYKFAKGEIPINLISFCDMNLKSGVILILFIFVISSWISHKYL